MAFTASLNMMSRVLSLSTATATAATVLHPSKTLHSKVPLSSFTRSSDLPVKSRPLRLSSTAAETASTSASISVRSQTTTANGITASKKSVLTPFPTPLPLPAPKRPTRIQRELKRAEIQRRRCNTMYLRQRRLRDEGLEVGSEDQRPGVRSPRYSTLVHDGVVKVLNTRTPSKPYASLSATFAFRLRICSKLRFRFDTISMSTGGGFRFRLSSPTEAGLGCWLGFRFDTISVFVLCLIALLLDCFVSIAIDYVTFLVVLFNWSVGCVHTCSGVIKGMDTGGGIEMEIEMYTGGFVHWWKLR
ncbi:hypothetical protein Nepgr_011739 [Nepenthes gracilis]|uniref:Uncharacterized protein n=1 Tax=Nepenthes gracilis TaxID=150966 RepID=A0AAD3XM70_NEPGR|nr:hypothetical protein Nepgr_011739 [Nepenthes gracilis]